MGGVPGDRNVCFIVAAKEVTESNAPEGAALIAQTMDRREDAAGAGVGAGVDTGTVSLPGSREFAAESRALDTRSFGYRFVKRTFDIGLSFCVCAVGLIPGAVLCAFIAADTKGAPLYAHERAGRFGRPIHVLKFRSMVADADDVEKYLTPAQIEEWHRERKVTNDPRITKLGRVLRKTSLDELPQFFNVLVGQLSVIGPGPLPTRSSGISHTSSKCRFLPSPRASPVPGSRARATSRPSRTACARSSSSPTRAARTSRPTGGSSSRPSL